MEVLNRFLGRRVDEAGFCNVNKGVVMTHRDYITYVLYAKMHRMRVNDLLNNALALAAEELRQVG